MAARVQPGRVQAAHQSLHHFVAKSEWSDDTVLAAVRAHVLPIIKRRGPIRALIIDDTGMPKKGKHSVGVARQYCGELGKQDNCQVAVSLSAANDHASLPIAYRLYLPHEWVDDPDRRAEAGVPDNVIFQTKSQIALDQLRAAVAAGIDAEVALADAGYGNDTEFRDGITEIGLPYAVGIQSSTSLWPPDILDPSRHRASADLGQATGTRPSQTSLAAGHLARRNQYQARLALRCRACPSCASRLSPLHAAPRGMVPDRMARG
jgi:SRSO17 transposase